ncbi:hypothetical protein GOP47_0022548 [Adiantum capillus-veneris]|uniref:Uncharacterized protein n=1 Tax=Adiantum capillus-veneris TaxID=13818 RepID=A0A9D4U7K4_ADICA|nr:hypothetical protein GOP47_0022548 [Adiantum capillus-veneris]
MESCREHEVHLPAAVEGVSSQEKTWNNGTHTVLASYGGHACERSFSLSTSHNLSLSSCMKLFYASNSRGDSFCSLDACHNVNEGLLLSSSYAEGLSSDPTLCIEFQQEKSYYKVAGKFMKNLRSALHHLHIQSSAALPAELTLKSSVSTDLQGNGYSSLDVAWSSIDSSFISRALFGSDGRRELVLQGSQSFWKATHVEVAGTTKYNGPKTFSFKLEHKFSKEDKFSVNVSSSCFRLQEASIMASLAQESRSWTWKYRKLDNNAHSFGFDWQFRGDADSVSSLSIEAGQHGVAVHGELSHCF